MASESTLEDTKDYFESNSYFGLEPSAVVFFEQHQLPCLTFEGKLILKTQGVCLPSRRLLSRINSVLGSCVLDRCFLK